MSQVIPPLSYVGSQQHPMPTSPDGNTMYVGGIYVDSVEMLLRAQMYTTADGQSYELYFEHTTPLLEFPFELDIFDPSEDAAAVLDLPFGSGVYVALGDKLISYPIGIYWGADGRVAGVNPGRSSLAWETSDGVNFTSTDMIGKFCPPLAHGYTGNKLPVVVSWCELAGEMYVAERYWFFESKVPNKRSLWKSADGYNFTEVVMAVPPEPAWTSNVPGWQVQASAFEGTLLTDGTALYLVCRLGNASGQYNPRITWQSLDKGITWTALYTVNAGENRAFLLNYEGVLSIASVVNEKVTIYYISIDPQGIRDSSVWTLDPADPSWKETPLAANFDSDRSSVNFQLVQGQLQVILPDPFDSISMQTWQLVDGSIEEFPL